MIQEPSGLYLIIELILDTILGILGITLILRFPKNKLRRIWGLMVLILAISMFNDNLCWLTNQKVILEQNLTLLSLSVILKWYLFVHAMSLFIVKALCPTWLTSLRIIAFSVPPIISATIVMCYIYFNGYITPLGSAANILDNISNTDVQVRLILFLFSVVTPTYNLLLPLIEQEPRHRLKNEKQAYICIAVFILLVCSYILFALALNQWIIKVYGFIVVILPIILSILFLRNENPIPTLLPIAGKSSGNPEGQQGQPETPSGATGKLYQRIAAHMRDHTPFTNPDYSLNNLVKEVGINRSLTMQAIREGGFSGFRKYINHLRLEYFKHLAATTPEATVKELMFRCGFTSRSSFYRLFAEQESISPKEYLEKLHIKPTAKQGGL